MKCLALSIILKCAVCIVYRQPFKVREKLYYTKIPKGRRYKTLNVSCNSVAFQCILAAGGKKITEHKSRSLYFASISAVLHSGVTFILQHSSGG